MGGLGKILFSSLKSKITHTDSLIDVGCIGTIASIEAGCRGCKAGIEKRDVERAAATIST